MTSNNITKDLNIHPIRYWFNLRVVALNLWCLHNLKTNRSMKKGLIRLLTTLRPLVEVLELKQMVDITRTLRNVWLSAKSPRRYLSIYPQHFTCDDFISVLSVSKRHVHYSASHLVTYLHWRSTCQSLKIRLTLVVSLWKREVLESIQNLIFSYY